MKDSAISLRRLIYLISFLLLPIDTTAHGAQAPAPIFLAFGGYGSCLRNTLPHQVQVGPIVQRVIAEARGRGAKPHVIYSCFHPTSGSSQDMVSYSIDGNSVRQDSVPNFLRTVIATLSGWGLGHEQLYIVGHSHGGWLALRLTASLRLLPKPPSLITSLVSIDPINYESCNAGALKTEVTASLSGRSSGNSACTRFIPSFALPRVGQETAHWLNYYQDRCRYLHSEALAGAINVRFNTLPSMNDEAFRGMDELVGTIFPDVDVKRLDVNGILAKIFENDELNLIYHTGIVGAVQDSIVRDWTARLQARQGL